MFIKESQIVVKHGFGLFLGASLIFISPYEQFESTFDTIWLWLFDCKITYRRTAFPQNIIKYRLKELYKEESLPKTSRNKVIN